MNYNKKYLKSIYENNKCVEFVEYLLKMNSYVAGDYAKVFCRKHHIKAVERTAEEEDERLKDIIRIAKTPWLDEDL